MTISELSQGKLSERFVRAFEYAARAHATQTRKGKDLPYISHLMSVASLVLEAGGDEDMTIAALLHDAVEDQGGQPTLREIERRFGKRVAQMVWDCTDADTIPKPPWRERKEKYLAHLPSASADSRVIAAADKVHNAREILADYREEGETVWGRFKGGREGTLWYYRALANELRNLDSNRLTRELDRVVTELERLAAAYQAARAHEPASHLHE